MQQARHPILNKISEGEGLHLDFKHSIGDSKKIARSLCAFANTEGGTLLIGVRDNKSIAGVNSDEEYYMIENAAYIYCKPQIEFSHKIHNISGKTVLEINVLKSNSGPHSAPDENGIYKYYLRVKDTNYVAPHALVEAWKLRNKNIKGIKLIFDSVVELILNEINENNSISKSKIQRITGISSKKADIILRNMLLMNILDVTVIENSIKYIFHKNYEYRK